MAKFGVTEKKEAALRARMATCNIAEEDLEERFVRGSGSGGQKVNKTSSCVYLLHKSTGTEVKVQQARSQAQNRFFARRHLCELIEAETLGTESPEAKRQAKIRKQKNRRKRRAQQAKPSTTETDKDI